MPAPEARGPAELPPPLRSQKCQRGEAGQGWHPEGKAPGWERGHLLEDHHTRALQAGGTWAFCPLSRENKARVLPPQLLARFLAGLAGSLAKLTPS